MNVLEPRLKLSILLPETVSTAQHHEEIMLKSSIMSSEKGSTMEPDPDIKLPSCSMDELQLCPVSIIHVTTHP